MEQFNPALENLVYLGNNYLRAFHGECPVPTHSLGTPHQTLSPPHTPTPLTHPHAEAENPGRSQRPRARPCRPTGPQLHTL